MVYNKQMSLLRPASSDKRQEGRWLVRLGRILVKYIDILLEVERPSEELLLKIHRTNVIIQAVGVYYSSGKRVSWKSVSKVQ